MAVQPRRPPYEVTVHARVCNCNQEPMRLGRAQKLDSAVRLIEGYWNVYLAFFGEQMVWLHFQVTDVRDGRVIWHNGQTYSTSGGFDAT